MRRRLQALAVGAALGAGLGLLLACVLVLLGRPDVSGPHAVTGLAVLAAPVVVSFALAGALCARFGGFVGLPVAAARRKALLAAAFALLAAVPALALAGILGGTLGGSYGEAIVGGRSGVALGLLVGIATIATPLLSGAALAGAHLGEPAAARATAAGPAPGAAVLRVGLRVRFVDEEAAIRCWDALDADELEGLLGWAKKRAADCHVLVVRVRDRAALEEFVALCRRQPEVVEIAEISEAEFEAAPSNAI